MRPELFIFVLFLVVSVNNGLVADKSVANNQIIKLNENWTIVSTNQTYTIRNLTVPFSVHSALLRDKYIDDPYFRFNDVNYRWITRDYEWTFTNSFRFDNNGSKKQVDIVFETIDTIASVYLNQQFILFARNEFLKYRIENIGPKLATNGSTNVLEIRFKSPIKYASYLAELYPYRQPQECPPDSQHGECHVNFLRKQQCSFSWDWGPAFAPVGLHGQVYLDVYETFDFEFSLAIHPLQMLNINDWIVDVLLKPNINEQSRDPSAPLVVTVSIDELGFIYNQTYIYPGDDQIHLVSNLSVLDYKSLKLWWPAGYGDQKLYDVSVQVNYLNNTIKKSKRSGFRSVQLVQQPVSATNENLGLSFFFRINLRDIFLKGSNWIPAHSFQEMISTDYLNWLMQSTVDANMNVLRVWGGGQYESDYFYDLADQMGIMIWQDFMFACSVYPTNEDFLQNVVDEVAYQVMRLRHRPSIIVWSGNNENEAAVSTNWYGTNVDRETYTNDYRKLYVSTVRNTLLNYDLEISRPFLSSSPTNGAESIAENWLANNPYDLRYGDLHFYNYEVNGWDPKSFQLPRFMSEYGIQSYPSISTLANVYNLSIDGNYASDLNEHRQHHGDGNKQILAEISNNLELPAHSDPYENFKALIYLSQLNQAMTYRTAAELFRRSRNTFDNVTGVGLTMGSMYWQLNDIWQGPTWSSMEFGGKWKMAHYLVKNAYSALLISPALDSFGKNLDIYAVSDLMSEIPIGTIQVSVYSYDSFEPKLELKLSNIQFSSLAATKVASLSLAQLKKATNCSLNSASNSCLITFTFSTNDGDSFSTENFFLMSNRLSDLTNLSKRPNLKILDVQKVAANKFSIQIQSDQVALFVWLDIDASYFVGSFSDNGFHMVTKRKELFYMTTDSSLTVQEMQRYLRIKSFVDVY